MQWLLELLRRELGCRRRQCLAIVVVKSMAGVSTARPTHACGRGSCRHSACEQPWLDPLDQEERDAVE